MFEIIKRYIDIALYSVISWLLICYIGQSEFAQNTIEGWRKFNDSLPYPIDYATYFIAGLLTKNILVNCGDYSIHHELYNESRFIIKSEEELSDLGWFNIKNRLYLLIANPPLRLSIFLFGGLVIATSNPAISGSYLTPILLYFLGIWIPQTIKSIFSSTPKIVSTTEEEKEPYSDKWYQYERPIRYLNEDYLGRTALVERLYNIIYSDEINDARGIAIVGGYGMGKTSLINMVLNKVMLSSHNFVTCHITTWGNYTSEENIQKIIIEQIISEVTKITSTTSLSGLPSKYINSLKGAQSLWLDALPLLDCHSSANSQLDKLNELLSRINHKVILVIEDIDRNDEKNKILNSIASLIDKLNSYSSFRVILSIGEDLYRPEVINRVCRYKENIIFDDTYKAVAIENVIKSLLSKSKLTYKSSESLFYSKKNPVFDKFIEAILSYITNIRDLKAILRELEYDWEKILCGSCDIVDLLAFTILKHFEPLLIEYISENKRNLTAEFIKNAISQNTELYNKENAEVIVNYLLCNEGSNNKSHRLQSCIFAPSKYIPLLIEKRSLEKNGKVVDQEFFSFVKDINELCKSAYSKENSVKIIKLLFKARKASLPTYVDNTWGYLFNSNSLTVMLYQLQYGLLVKGTKRKYYKEPIGQASLIMEKFSLSTNNPELCNQIIKHIVHHQLSEEHSTTLNDIYINILNRINKGSIYRPDTNDIIDFYEREYYSRNETTPSKSVDVIIDAMFSIKNICMGNVDNKDRYPSFIEPFKNKKSTFIEEFLDTIKTWSEAYRNGALTDNNFKTADWYQRRLDEHQ
ncbi:P-loop NTPase fold protein [Aeromonas veronii]